MPDRDQSSRISRRRMIGAVGKAAVAIAILQPVLGTTIFAEPPSDAGVKRRRAGAGGVPVAGKAGIDRVVVLPGKTYLRGWAGYGAPPRQDRSRRAQTDSTPPVLTGPAPSVRWRKRSGPGRVTFADPTALVTTATFTAPGAYVVELTADNGETTASSTLNVKAELHPR